MIDTTLHATTAPTGSGADRRPELPVVNRATAPRPAGSAGDMKAAVSPEIPGADPATASLWAALRDVRDPELPVSLVDLGLIYAIRRDGGTVHVDLTFTATACPCMDFIREDASERLLEEPDVDAVEIHVVWDPPWTVERMTPEGREALRRCGVAA